MGIQNKNGALFFATGIDNSGLKKDSEEAKRYIQDISDFAKNAGKTLGVAFGVGALKQFGQEIINVRGEMQMLETSFEVLLGGKGVPAFMSEIKQFAVDSPLSLSGVSQAAQTLLGFNVEAEKVIPTIKQLGDISMGNEQRFQSLALAFAQMSSTGKLMGQDLLQMINAGFNPLSVISEKTGKSIADLKKEMESGAISSQMVADAFASATAEGGKFYGMTQKQAEGIKGLQAQLEGAWQDVFNNLGKSQEDFIYSGYKGAISLVENYEQVGKILAEVVVALGVYKAAIISVDSYKQFTASVKYTEEAKSLEALLTVEEKKRISTLNLKSGTEEHVKAIQREIEIRGQNLKAQIAESAAESNRLAQKKLAGKEAKIAASENVAAKQAELAAIIGTAEAEKTVALQKKMLLASEKQSRAALLVNKLEEQKADAISQAQSLKDVGATEAKIAAKNREIASIHAKIIAAKEEEIQQARNVVALRSEIAAVSGNVSSKKTEAAQKRLNTAVLQENTVAQNYNSTVKELAAAKAKTMTAAQQLETLSTNVDTASKKANITFTTLLTAAKTKLAAVAVKLNAVLSANAFSIALAGAVALTYGLYKLITYQTTAEKQQKKLNESLETEKLRLDALVESLKRAEPGTERYNQIKKEINDNYGSYLDNLNLEVDVLGYSKDAYYQLTAAIESNTRAKLRNQFIDENNQELGKSIGSRYSSLRKRLTGDLGAERGKQAFSDIKARIEDAALQDAGEINRYIKTIFEESGKSSSFAISKYYNDVNSILSSKYQLKEILEEADDIFGDAGSGTQKAAQDINQQVEETKTKIAVLKKDLADLRSGKTESTDYKTDIEAKEKELKSVKETLELLTGESEKLANKAQKDAQKIANSTLELKRASVERELAVRQAELDISQARIDMMEDGFAKQEKQIELNHNKELLSIQRRTQELIQAQQEIERKEWERAGSKGVFKPTTFSIGQLPTDQQGELNNWYDTAWASYRSNQAKNQKALLDQYRTYEQQRADINKKFDADAKAIKDQNLADEKERLAVLEKLRKESLKSINNAEIAETEKSSQLFVKLFSDASRMSTGRIKEVTAEAKKLVDYLSGVNATVPAGFTEGQLEAMKADPEKIKAIYDALIQKQDELDDRTNYPFAGIIKGFNSWKEAAENTEKASKAANEETRRYLLAEADAQRAKGLEYIKDGAVEAADGLSSLADLMQKLAEASGDSRFSEFASQMGALSENISAAAKGFQQGGWIGAIIGGAQNMIEQTIASFAQAKAEQKEFEQNRLDFLNAYNLKLLEVDDKDFDTIFGSSGLEKAREASKNAQEALTQYYEIIRKTTSPETQKEFRSLAAAIFGGLHFGSWIGLTKTMSSESKALLDAYKKGYTDIQGMAIKTKDYSGWANFWGKKDKYTSLKDLAKDLWDDNGEFNVEAAQAFLDTNTQITDEQRKQIQAIIDMKGRYEDLMDVIRDDLRDTFGGLGDGLMDSIENAIRTGANKWDLFRKSGEEALEALGRKMSYELFFSKKFAKLQEDLEKTYELDSSEAVAKRQMELMANFFDTIGTDMDNAQKWMEQWQAEAEKRGFELWKDEASTSGVTGELKAQMTEQTGSQLVGLWNMTAMDIRGIREFFEKNPMPDMGKELNALLNELQAIKDNTRETADNTGYLEEGIKKLEEKLDKIEKNTKPNTSRI
ncbi:tape measure protein [Proteiniphilum acetatigenes]|uniref:tape measure protein n=1 Tax=Proteiniphilum acetatigenes TaxID=294710 RepID=UPI00037D623A|nr:tape measure protein [Proteiniphilum acetatigenes]